MSRRVALASAWTLLILALCWWPRQGMPVSESGSLIKRIPHLDKVVHFGLFAPFAALWVGPSGGKRRAVSVFLAGVVLAIVTEVGQGSSLVNRDPDPLDALADIAGAGAGALAASWYARRSALPASEME